MFSSLKTTFNPQLSGVLNLPYFIIGQTGDAALAWGIPGEAKTAYVEALAKWIGHKFYHFIPSLHIPDDLSGIPRLNKADEFAKMVPIEFIAACREAGWVFFFYEVNTSRPEMRPPLLSLLNEGRVGSIQWHPLTMRFAATNPEDWAPNSSPLEASICNRMFHWQWEFPAESFHEGLCNGLQFKVNDVFPTIYHEYMELMLPVIGKVTSSFLKAQPDCMRLTKAPDEGVNAYHSPRTWTKVVRGLAAAASCGAPFETYGDIVKGWVGEGCAAKFCTYLAARDLYDIDELVDGTAKPDCEKDRVDQLIHLPWCMVDNLEHRARRGVIEDKFCNNVVEIMLDLGEHDLLDCVVGPMTKVAKVAPEYSMPRKLATRWDDLIEQVYA